MNIKIEAIGSEIENDRVLDVFMQALRGLGNIEKISVSKVGGVMSIQAEVEEKSALVTEDWIDRRRAPPLDCNGASIPAEQAARTI